MGSAYPYIDRNSCIIAAGKSFGDPCAKVKDCFNDVLLSEKVDAVRKQFGLLDRKDFGPERKGPQFSGVFSEIEGCLRGPPKSQFQVIEEEVTNTVYDSYWNKALGKTRDPTPGLPLGMDIYCTTFGKPSISSCPAGEIVNPRKTSGEIIYEDKICHDLYKFSHQDYYPGEKLQRSYAPPFNACNTYGAPSNVDTSGLRAKKIMTWFNNDPLSHVSRRQAAVRERTSAPIGRALDKTGVTNLFGIYHTYGKPSEHDCCGVEDLMNEYTQSKMRRDVREFIACANKLRRNIHQKTSKGELMLDDLYDEFVNLDQERAWCLHFDCIDKICKKHLIHLDRSKIEPLLIILGILKPDGIIRYKDFLDFLDPSQNFPSLKREHYIMPPEYQSYDKAAVITEEKCSCKNYFNAPAGISSNPTRKSGPFYSECRINVDHLAAETNARAVISPSIYTQYGLNHRDFFRPRTKEFLANLFKRIGCTLSEEDVDELYKEGAEMDQTGGVCVETFRNILDARAYKTYNRLLP